MSDKLNEIQRAIDTFQLDHARELLHEELAENPTADVYYLASQAAVNHGQRVDYLNKAIDLDPFHKPAHDELASMMPRTTPRKPPIDTQPIPQLNLDLAPNDKRIFAFAVDFVILGIIGSLVGAFYNAFFGPDIPEALLIMPEYEQEYLQLQITLIALGLLVNFVYYIYFLTKTNGQTPGKMLAGIRIVKQEGTPITIGDAFLRNIVGYMISSIFMLGYIFALTDKNKQGWHDKIAGTYVVNDSNP